MRCEKIEKWLSDKIDEELSERQKRILKSHLEKCSSCQAYIRDLEKIQIEARSLENPELSPDDWIAFTSRLQRSLSSLKSEKKVTFPFFVRWRWQAAGVALIAVIALGLLLLFYPSRALPELHVFSFEESFSQIYKEIGRDQDLEEMFNSILLVSIGENLMDSGGDKAPAFHKDFYFDNFIDEEMKWIVNEIEKGKES
jgi:hypothetical protein